MLRLFKRFKDWRSQKLNPSLEQWEQIRAKGKARYVFNEVLTMAVSVTVATDLLGYILAGGVPVFRIRTTILANSIAGWILGNSSWSTQEDKYKKAICQSSPGDKIALP